MTPQTSANPLATQRTLLLVGDSPDIVSALKLLLRDGDLRILTAESAEDGLRMLAIKAVDVVIFRTIVREVFLLRSAPDRCLQ